MTTMTRGRSSSSMPGPTVRSGTCSGRAPPTADGARVDYTDHGLRGCERRRVGWGRRAGPDRSRLRTGVERGERPGDLRGQLGECVGGQLRQVARPVPAAEEAGLDGPPRLVLG